MIEKVLMEDLENFKELFSNIECYFFVYLLEVKIFCWFLWVKFDFNLIFVGIFVLFIGIVVGVLVWLEIDVYLVYMVLIIVVGFGVVFVVIFFMFNFLVVVFLFFIGVFIFGVC